MYNGESIRDEISLSSGKPTFDLFYRRKYLFTLTDFQLSQHGDPSWQDFYRCFYALLTDVVGISRHIRKSNGTIITLKSKHIKKCTNVYFHL